MGNVTAAIKYRGTRGSQRYVAADITLSSSYATSGDTVTAAVISLLLDEGGFALTDVICADFEVGPAGHALRLDRANKKILAFNGTTEIANTTNLSTVVSRCVLTYGDVSAQNA